MCIISTAQQASPNVIHISEPVRAQVIRSSTAVMTKPLSASSLLTPTKNSSSAPTGLPVRGSRIPCGAGETSVIGPSIPFERALLPFVDEADGEHAKEDHHRPEANEPDLAERHRPRKEERHFEIENDEQDGDQVEAHVELHARVVEGVDPAFVSGQFFRIGLFVGDDEWRDQQDQPNHERDRDEHNQRKIIQHQCAHGDLTYSPAPVREYTRRGLFGSPKRRRSPAQKKPLRYVQKASKTGALEA